MIVTKHLTVFPLLCIFLLAIFLRTYHLSSTPPGFHVDEVKVVWNAYSLLKTGRDDWTHPFPLHYNTFGDFRPTGYFYITIPVIQFFGLNELSTRLPPAIFGSLTVLILFYFVRYLTGNHRIALLCSLMLCLSPWQITLSRASSEGIISMNLLLTSLVFLLRSLKSRLPANLILAFTFTFLSYLFYHPARVLAPIFTATILIYYRRYTIHHLLFLLFISTLALLFFLTPDGRGRFSQVSILTNPAVKSQLTNLHLDNTHLSQRLIAKMGELIILSTSFINEYTKYISGRFFIIPGEAKPLRYDTANIGVTLYPELFLVILGIYAVTQRRFPSLPLIILLLAPIPAAVTYEDAPNLHRALMISPMLSILAGFGLYYLHQKTRLFTYLILIMLMANFTWFWFIYNFETISENNFTKSRNYGVKELITKINSLKSTYPKILLTNAPDSLYSWYAFYNHLSPQIFNTLAKNRNLESWSYSGVVFTQSTCPSKNLQKGELAVDGEGCIEPPEKFELVSTISGSAHNGSNPYTLWKLK